MKIHLIRSEEISKSRFRTIAEIIGKFKGPIDFNFLNEDISEDSEDIIKEDFEDFNNISDKVVLSESDNIRKYALKRQPWNLLFGHCETFRNQNKIKSDEPVVLLTDYGNERNWFSSWEPSGKLNFFVQTSMWDTFIEAESCYPIIYELATIPLGLATCKNLQELKEMAHQNPRGCAFDFCQNKSDVQLKLRTADICLDCQEKMIQKKIDPAIVRQVFAILDGIRNQMLFRERFSITKQPSRLEIDLAQRKLQFTDIGNVSVKLDPREMTVYRFFLKKVTGVAFNYMPDYKADILTLYRKHSNTEIEATLVNRVNAIVLNLDDTLSWLISNINKKIKATVGSEIADNYMIKGEKGEPRYISLDRNLFNTKVYHVPVVNKCD